VPAGIKRAFLSRICGKQTLLSIASSRFLMKTLPWPVLRKAGSRWDHMMRLGMKMKFDAEQDLEITDQARPLIKE
jgi:hypothetical protein